MIIFTIFAIFATAATFTIRLTLAKQAVARKAAYTKQQAQLMANIRAHDKKYAKEAFQNNLYKFVN